MIVDPIYLYIKKHNVTGLMYFGRTINPDPNKYNGSGVYWTNYLKKYGYDISTIFFEKFDNQEDATEFALLFSEEFNIVENNMFANLIVEDAKPQGNLKGFKHSPEVIEQNRLRNAGENHPNYGNPNNFKHSEETKEKLRLRNTGENNPRYGTHHTEESKLKSSISNTGLKRSEETKRKISESLKLQYKMRGV